MSTVSTLRTHSKEFLIEVIELYKNHPCLWKMKCKEYSDREKKAEAYALMIEKFKETIEDQNSVDRNLVAKKINCLRSSYRLEKKKISDAAALGKVYRSNLWCFDLLRFLDENDIHQQRTSFVGVDDNSNDTFESPEYLQISPDISEDLSNPSPTLQSPDNDDESDVKTPRRFKKISDDPIGLRLSKRRTNTIKTHFESSSKNKRNFQAPAGAEARKRKRNVSHDAIYSLLGDEEVRCKDEASRRRTRHNKGNGVETVDDPMTQFDYAAKAWAVTLNDLPRNQQLYASRIINEVLYQAQIGKLNEDTGLVISAPKTPNEDRPITFEYLEPEEMEFDMKGEV